jgi:hypothetical protein
VDRDGLMQAALHGGWKAEAQRLNLLADRLRAVLETIENTTTDPQAKALAHQALAENRS